MAKTKISEFSSTPANNTDIDSINIAEGCAPSGINDAIRELMAQLKDFQTGAQGDSFNGPIGTSTAAAGAFTTLSATGAITSTLATGTAPLVIASTTKVSNLNVDLLDGADWASPAALGSTTPAAVSATTLSASSTVTLSGGTANGVAYLNGSKVVTSGSALTFDGTNFTLTSGRIRNVPSTATANGLFQSSNTGGGFYTGIEDSTGSLFAGTGYAGVVWHTGNYPIAFGLNNTEQMRLTSTGLGIGTSSPAYKLDVRTGSGNAYANVGRASKSAGQVALQLSGGTSGTDWIIYQDTNSDNLRFFGNSDTRMTLDSSGNLGLGVTPSAFSGAKVMQINGASFAGDDTIWRTRMLVNAYNDGSYRYLQNNYAQMYVQNSSSGDHSWYLSPSGTAGNAITFTQAMTLDASGNLVVGGTSANVYGASKAITLNAASGQSCVYEYTVAGTSTGFFGGSSTATWIGSKANIPLVMYTNDTERARIDSSGNLLVGTTSNAPAGTQSQFVNHWSGGSKWGASFDQTVSSATQYTHINFSTNGTTVGYINANNSITTYNSVSDYRLKTVIGAVSGSGERIDALEPIEYEWKVDGSRTRGFLAHKFQEVYAGSVSGDKDAVDANGNPVYQAMQASTSEVIADLVAEIQSLRKRLANAGL